MKTILLVEDNPFILDIYAIQFRKEGYRVDLAKDCEMASEKLKDNYPDLIILDIDFGKEKINGFEFLRIMRQDTKTKNLKVIVASNINKENYPEDAYNLGVINFFLKVENTSEEIIGAIKEILK